MIESFISRLAQSLHGPWRAKQRLLAEAKIGLADAVQAYRAVGLDASSSTARALADFGTVAEVKAAFQGELDIARTRYAARLSLLLIPLLTLFWNVAWELNPYPTWQVLSIPFLIALTTSVLALSSAVIAGAELAVTGHYGHGGAWTGVSHAGARLLAGTGAFAVTTVTLPTLNPEALLWPPAAVAVIAAATLGLVAGVAYRRWFNYGLNLRPGAA